MTETATYDPTGLIAGDHPLTHAPIVVLSGQNIARGAVLGRVTASGKYVLSTTGASDGSQVPAAIAAEAINAAAGDVTGPAYFTGEFNGAQLVYGASHTAVTVEASFRATGRTLFVRTLL
jgi:hypothetical protein